MTLYRAGLTANLMEEVLIRDFAELQIREREHIQQLILNNPGVLGQGAEELLILAEEFGDWDGADRRIDLLAIDSSGTLVVIELKRTKKAELADLQAIRYAAMVSSMDFEEASKALMAHRKLADLEDARTVLSAHLSGDHTISEKVGIILMSAGFDREITTTAHWLTTHYGMSIKCIELIPYQINDELHIEIQQIFPLPQIEDYQVKIGRKQGRALPQGAGRPKDTTRYQIADSEGISEPLSKRGAALRIVQSLVAAGVSPEQIEQIKWKKPALIRLTGLFDQSNVIEAINAQRGGVRPEVRFHTGAPIPSSDGASTYLVSNQWSADIREYFDLLTSAFPASGVRAVAVSDSREGLSPTSDLDPA